MSSLGVKREFIISASIAGVFFLGGAGLEAQSPGAARRNIVPIPGVQHDTLRDALTQTFVAISHARNSVDARASLSQARMISVRYLMETNDSFLIRQVADFARRTALEKKARVVADSLRVTGNAALSREGVPQAMLLWREGLKRASSIDDQAAIAPTLVAIGAGFYRTHELDSALSYIQRGKLLATRIGDYRTIGNALGILASIRKDLGDTSKAVDLYHAALTMRSRSGDTRGMAADENNLGLIARARGNRLEATHDFERAFELNSNKGSRSIAGLNLANLASVAADFGEYSRSDSLFRLALSFRKANGDLAETAFILEDLGRLQTRRGEYSAASATLMEALRIHEKSGATAEATALRADLAELVRATGHPDKALQILERAERIASGSSLPPRVRADLALARGDLYVEVNNLKNAGSEYLRAESLYGDEKDAAGIAKARYGRAFVLHAHGDDLTALNFLEESYHQQIAARETQHAAITELLTSTVQRSRGDAEGSLRSLSHARNLFSATSDRVGEAATLALLGEAALARVSSTQAEALFREGLSRLGSRQANDVQWRLHAGLGEAMQKRGNLRDAAMEFRTATTLVEKAANGISRKEDRYGFLKDKWSVYTQLAMLQQSRGRTAEAFVGSERLRARQLVDILARGRIQSVTPAATTEQDAWRGINNAEVPTHTVSWQEISAHLESDEVLIEYLIGDLSCSAFIITRDSIHAVTLPIGHQSLAELIEFSRRATERANGSGSAALWRPSLQRLYRELIQPIEENGYLAGKRKILIIPNGELYFVSFAALIPPGAPNHFLIERFDIEYAPSATAWVEIADRKFPSSAKRVIAFAPQAEQLPGAHAEVLAIGKIYGRTSLVRIGGQATKRALRAALVDAGTIHLATYGILNRRNPLSSYVKLAPESGDDGKLGVSEVFGLRLSGQLVILSACVTGLAAGADDEIPEGDDWVGLVHAFLQAGANTVLASLWPVDDETTATLMERFHEHIAAGASPAAAIAQAQRAALRVGATRSPFFWAAFVVNGSQ